MDSLERTILYTVNMYVLYTTYHTQNTSSTVLYDRTAVQ